MPLLAAFIGGLLASIAEFFGKWLTIKTTIGLAAVAMFATLTVACMVIIASSINAILPSGGSGGAVPHWFAVGFNLFMPTHFVAGIAGIISAKITVALYHWNVTNLKLFATAQ